jgi:hypothetical protein
MADNRLEILPTLYYCWQIRNVPKPICYMSKLD